MNITLDEYPEMSMADIEQAILFEVAEMQAYKIQMMHPTEDRGIINQSITMHKENLNQLYRLKKMRSTK